MPYLASILFRLIPFSSFANININFSYSYNKHHWVSSHQCKLTSDLPLEDVHFYMYQILLVNEKKGKKCTAKQK